MFVKEIGTPETTVIYLFVIKALHPKLMVIYHRDCASYKRLISE